MKLEIHNQFCSQSYCNFPVDKLTSIHKAGLAIQSFGLLVFHISKVNILVKDIYDDVSHVEEWKMPFPMNRKGSASNHENALQFLSYFVI